MGFRIRVLPREKAAFIVLRKKGLSLNQIAECFGRSTSVVHRALKRVEGYGYRLLDMRKLPYRTRLRFSIKRHVLMLKLRDAWAQWILSEEGEPP